MGTADEAEDRHWWGAGTLNNRGWGIGVGAGSQPNRQTLCCKGAQRASVFYHRWTSGFTMNSSQPAFSFVCDLGISPTSQPQAVLTLEDTCQCSSPFLSCSVTESGSTAPTSSHPRNKHILPPNASDFPGDLCFCVNLAGQLFSFFSVFSPPQQDQCVSNFLAHRITWGSY